MSPRLRFSVCLVIGALALGAVAPVASAQTDPTPGVLRVEGVDGRGDTWEAVGVSSEGDPTVSIGDKTLATESTPQVTDVVVVIDNDRGLTNGNLQLSGDAAAALVPGSDSIRNVAVVTTARQGARQEIGLTSDPGALGAAIDGILADGDAATWDAITRAADLLEGSDATSKRVVAFLSAADKLSLAQAGSAETALRLADARLDVVTLPGGVNTTALTEMVLGAGGSLALIESDDDYEEASAAVIAHISEQFRLRFAVPPGESQSVVLSFNTSDAQQVVQADRGALTIGTSALSVSESTVGLLEGLMANSFAGWLVAVLIAVAVVGMVWSLASMLLPDANSLSRRLKAYDEAGDDEGVEDDADAGVATVPILKRAVALTSEVAEKRGFLDSLEVSLERASLPLRAAEAVFFLFSASLLIGVAVLAFTRNPLVGLGATLLTLLIPKALLDMKVRRRHKAFVGKLPDMLALLAGTLKAGYSITQGFEAVSKEVEDPMGMELRRVVTEHRLGRSLEDALDATADRMGSDDFAWTVMAIKIQREVGGNLAELLMTVANTMTQRERLRRDVNSLTAEGRMSAIILGLLPPGLGTVMYFMNREYLMDLFTPGLGYVMIGAAVIAMIIGFIWMKKIITIEV